MVGGAKPQSVTPYKTSTTLPSPFIAPPNTVTTTPPTTSIHAQWREEGGGKEDDEEEERRESSFYGCELTLQSAQATFFNPELALAIEEFHAITPNPFFTATQLYLKPLAAPNMKSFCAALQWCPFSLEACLPTHRDGSVRVPTARDGDGGEGALTEEDAEALHAEGHEDANDEERHVAVRESGLSRHV
ncbi:mitochondrial chaperone BCS1-B [Spatholobus suberectus]|nr:mitochondrial chaperone BCS1-B [Spatholobus suberectus]